LKRITEQSYGTYKNNNTALESEYKLIQLGKGFLEEFLARCRESSVDHAEGNKHYSVFFGIFNATNTYRTDFSFTDAIIAREVVEKTPSIPSGLASEELCDEFTDITWLLEPRRTIEVTKYSGTMQPAQVKTLPYMTMAAFAHYTYQVTDGDLVFVDLQGRG